MLHSGYCHLNGAYSLWVWLPSLIFFIPQSSSLLPHIELNQLDLLVSLSDPHVVQGCFGISSRSIPHLWVWACFTFLTPLMVFSHPVLWIPSLTAFIVLQDYLPYPCTWVIILLMLIQICKLSYVNTHLSCSIHALLECMFIPNCVICHDFVCNSTFPNTWSSQWKTCPTAIRRYDEMRWDNILYDGLKILSLASPEWHQQLKHHFADICGCSVLGSLLKLSYKPCRINTVTLWYNNNRWSKEPSAIAIKQGHHASCTLRTLSIPVQNGHRLRQYLQPPSLVRGRLRVLLVALIAKAQDQDHLLPAWGCNRTWKPWRI